MTCRHFKKVLEPVSETGSMTPSVFEIWHCALGRDVVANMHKRCTATPYNGQCWQERPQEQE